MGNKEKELLKKIEERKLDIDYNKLKKIIEEATKEPFIEVSRRRKVLKKLNEFLFKTVLPIATVIIAMYGHMISFNNSSLTYEYYDQTIKGVDVISSPFGFTIDGNKKNYARVPIEIKLKVTSGSIKSLYLAKLDSNGNLVYEKLSNENIRKKLFYLRSPTADLKFEVDTSSTDKIQNVSVWLIIVDNKNNVFIDFYEVITASVIETGPNSVLIDTKYKENDFVYNYRVVKYDTLFDSDFLNKAKWNNEENIKYSTYDEEKILECIKVIKERFENIYK